MPDLPPLLAAEAERLRPASTPEYVGLVRRARSRRRQRRLVALSGAAAAVALVALAIPALQHDDGARPERLAQSPTQPPTQAPADPVPPIGAPTSRPTAVPKGPPPSSGFAYTVLVDGEPLPGNAWELVVDRRRELVVEIERTGVTEVCMLTFAVETESGGAPVARGVQQGPSDDPGARRERLVLAWDGTGDDGAPVPPGRYRLVARTLEQDRPCGTPGDDGPRAEVASSLGLLVVPG